MWKYLFGILLVFKALNGFALRYEQDARFVYVKQTIPESRCEECGLIVDDSLKIIAGRLAFLFPETEISKSALLTIEKSHDSVEDLLVLMRRVSNSVTEKTRLYQFSKQNTYPTGIFIFSQVHGQNGVGVSGGTGLSVGVIAVPYLTTRVDKITKEFSQYFEVEWAICAFANLGVGYGTGVSGGIVSGIGGVWGYLEGARDIGGFGWGLDLTYDIKALSYDPNFKLIARVPNLYSPNIQNVIMTVAGSNAEFKDNGAFHLQFVGMPIFGHHAIMNLLPTIAGFDPSHLNADHYSGTEKIHAPQADKPSEDIDALLNKALQFAEKNKFKPDPKIETKSEISPPVENLEIQPKTEDFNYDQESSEIQECLELDPKNCNQSFDEALDEV